MAVRAPAIPTDAIWLNVKRPMTAEDLRGRVVLLHFWTYACINCQHALPVLDALTRELAGEAFVVVSIHSPKFPAQREAERVREAVAQLEVTHPVVLDPDGSITQSFAVTGWPTLLFVDPRGYLVGVGRGEPEPQALLGALRQALAQYAAEGSLDNRPLPVGPPPRPVHRLSFPTALAADDATGRVFVADAGHHQVVICDAEGTELARLGGLGPVPAGDAGTETAEGQVAGSIAGSGAAPSASSPGSAGVSGVAPHSSSPGSAGVSGVAPHSSSPGSAGGSGAASQGGLRRPCGLALVGEDLYIADTGNHAVRAFDLTTLRMRTVVEGRGLRSPWGLAFDGSRLFIASAGTHQIWVFDPSSGHCGLFAGTGAEGGRDGAATTATFAQPSGLACLDGVLYVADSETSSIRAIRMAARAGGSVTVTTLCGAGDLFGFGDADGAGSRAELQHPIGLTASPERGLLYVADTFNHKVRLVDPATGSCRTLFGNGESELNPAPPSGATLGTASSSAPAFCEPEGLAISGAAVLVADTGNHRVLSVSLLDGARRVLIGD